MLCIYCASSAQSTFQSNLKAQAQKGANIYGVVESNGQPMAGVAVSDGVEIVLTNKKGCYNIKSDKKHGYVFVILPSCYEAPITDGDVVPAFWANLNKDTAEAERHDFQLSYKDNRKHAMIAVTDIHLANMYHDQKQFHENFMPRLKEEVNKYSQQGIPVYTICAGDSSFDLYWYDYLYDIITFRSTLKQAKYPTPFFNVMGNHDHDGAISCGSETDWKASQKYRDSFGPLYYSYNIGDVHYIMLDNIIYINSTNGAKKPGKNIVGKRNYSHGLTEEQLEWLQKDLALVENASTPIVIVMHCPLCTYTNKECTKIRTYFTRMEGDKKISNDFESVGRLAKILEKYNKVHFVTGHTHRNITCWCKNDTSHPELKNIVDINIGAVSGSWWRTNAYGYVSLGPDTAPTGFEVFPVDGQKVEWYWTSIDDGSNKQFRVFDGNEVRKYYQTNQEVRVLLSHYDNIFDFSSLKDNEVLIHVWAWDPTWKVEAFENGKALPVRREITENPQHTLAYVIPKTSWKQHWPKRNGQEKTDHIFSVTASAPNTPIEIRVTDHFGKVYTDTVQRPKEFSLQMK